MKINVKKTIKWYFKDWTHSNGEVHAGDLILGLFFLPVVLILVVIAYPFDYIAKMINKW